MGATARKVGNYFVAIYNPVSNTPCEYNGAVFDGCPCRTEPDDLVPFAKITMAQAYENWEKKLEFLKRRGLNVEVM